MYKYIIEYIALTVLLTAIIVVPGCDYSNVKSSTTIGTATMGVDENLSPVMQKEIDEFMRLNKEAKIIPNVKTTNELIADLINGDTLAKTVIVAREFNKEETDIINNNKIEIKKYQIAIDGVGIIVHPQNPLTGINYNELRKVYLGEIKNWEELEGENKNVYKGKIKSFIARGNSSLHEYMKMKILNNADFAKTNIMCTTSAQMMDEIKKDPLALGFISMNWVTKFADTLLTVVKPLEVAAVDSAGTTGNYVGLHQGYIANNTYPLRYDLWYFTREWGMNVSSGFINFLLSYDGQKIVLNSGLVPVSQPVRIIQLN